MRQHTDFSLGNKNINEAPGSHFNPFLTKNSCQIIKKLLEKKNCKLTNKHTIGIINKKFRMVIKKNMCKTVLVIKYIYIYVLKTSNPDLNPRNSIKTQSCI